MTIRDITKALGGQQDILFGTGDVNQTRNEVVYSITRINKIHILDNITLLALLPVDDANLYFEAVQTLGATTRGDGEGAMFYYDSTEPHVNADGITIIVAFETVTNGCWKQHRLLDTTTNFADINATVNTGRKFAGKQYWNTTLNRPIWAAGSLAADIWVDGVGTTVHIPV